MLPNNFFLQLIIMAGVTYLIRMLPFTLFQRRIRNKHVQSFLFYIPYAVLAAMTFPAVFGSTDMLLSAVAGILVAIILAYFEKSLIVVAVAACVTVWITEQAFLLFKM